MSDNYLDTPEMLVRKGVLGACKIILNSTNPVGNQNIEIIYESGTKQFFCKMLSIIEDNMLQTKQED